MDGVSVRLVESVADAEDMLRWLGERRPILAVDTETCGLHWWEHPVRLAQFGDSMGAWAMDFGDWRGLAREVMRTYTGPIVMHNAKFDMHMLSKWGGIRVRPGLWHDTMIASQVLDPLGRHGLKPLAVKLIHPMADAGESMLADAMSKQGWDWDTVPTDLPAYWAYGCLDTVFTARLHEMFQQRLTAENLMPLYELEMRVVAALFAMEQKGALLDLDYVETTNTQLLEYKEVLRTWCQTNYSISPSNDDELRARLQADGIVLTHLTDSGDKLSVDKDVLGSLDHPLAGVVLRHRTVSKFQSTYFRRFLELNDNGRLHANIRSMGAKTGRMSVSEPPLQQLPSRENPVLPNRLVRDAFIAGPGQQLLSADYEQVEMRLFAHFAREESMINAIRSGIDLHTATAQGVYHTQTPTKPQRSVAKNANFARVYGAGVAKFSLTARISETEGAEFMQAYDLRFPGVTVFAKQVESVARSRASRDVRPFVRAPSGRLHAVYKSDDTYKLVNYLVQGTAADVFKEALVNLDAHGLLDYLRLPVHDEVIMEIPVEEIANVRSVLPQLMENHQDFLVPIEIDIEGPYDRWGDKYA